MCICIFGLAAAANDILKSTTRSLHLLAATLELQSSSSEAAGPHSDLHGDSESEKRQRKAFCKFPVTYIWGEGGTEWGSS
jgi:hypothetical protein